MPRFDLAQVPQLRLSYSSWLVAALVAALPLRADVRLVRDIHPGPGNGLFHHEIIITPPEIETSFLAAAGDVLFFSADDGIHGAELWLSSGTEQGTRLVKDIREGPESSLAFPLDPPRAWAGGIFYFVADDGVHGPELWRSDGSEEGTFLVKDIRPGLEGPRIRSLTAGENGVFFAANDGLNGQALWKSDGTLEGTAIVRDVDPAPSTFSIGRMVDVAGTLYFAALDGISGSELWKSDGTSEGTVMVKDIEPGPAGSGPYVLGATRDGTILLRAKLGGLGLPGFGAELWRTDGTPGGTVMVKDIQQGDQSSSPDAFVTAGGKHFFLASSEFLDFSKRLLTTDGTTSGTFRVPLPPELENAAIAALTATEDAIFFAAYDAIWRHDPATGETAEIFDASDRHFGPRVTRGNWLIWRASNLIDGETEIWATDGTPGEEILLARFPVQPASFQPQFLTLVGHRVFFDAFYPDLGRELWVAPLKIAARKPYRRRAP